MVDLAWAQWSVLSTMVSARQGEGAARSIVDPEVLLLLSLIGHRKEGRLLDVVAAWMKEGLRYASMQRARTISATLPDMHGFAFGNLAALATRAGDHRWKRYVTPESDGLLDQVRDKQLGPIRLDAPPTLLLRLRAGFGVGTKADALALLLGSKEPVNLRSIAENLGYGSRPLRLALEDLVLAGFVERIASTPATFRASSAQWDAVLNAGHHAVPARQDYPPAWLPWADVLVLCCHIQVWGADCEDQNFTEYVAASRARDIIEQCATPSLVQTLSLRLPRSTERWDLPALSRFVSQLDERVRANW